MLPLSLLPSPLPSYPLLYFGWCFPRGLPTDCRGRDTGRRYAEVRRGDVHHPAERLQRSATDARQPKSTGM